MARARDVPGFDCDEPFGHAAARAVELRAAEVFEHSERVLDLDDVEPLHDMRVATRRLRAAMELFEPCFPAKLFGKTLKEVKALADALGERRDRDVEIEFLKRFVEEGAGREDREPIARLVARLRVEQLRANYDLMPFVVEERLERLRRRLAKLSGAAVE